MWQWNDGTMELCHYGVKGMKWGVRKTRPQGGVSGLAKAAKATRSVLSDIGRPMDGNGWTPKLKSNGHSQYDEQRRTAKKLEKYTKSFGKTAAKKDHTVMDTYKAERKRQKSYLTTKRAVQVGRSMANQYLQSHNATLNGKPLRVNSTAVAVVNSILDYKYMKDTFK